MSAIQALLEAIIAYIYRVSTYNWVVVVVELLLIGSVVWWAMRFLRGTRGARLIKGVALMLATVYVVIGLLPRGMQWERISFLYGKFLLFTFVAAVVAFQPELRRALIQIGQARLFRSTQNKADAIVDALVDSASYLSRNKIGAIVAVERSVPLGTLAETGTLMDALLTSNLLNAVFYPGGVLHDMGVIVRNGRILAAGCQLPLAESEDVDPALGSRHRAAMGMAQETDAVVLVVSEETGRVSLAYDGQLVLGLELESLREMLLGLLAPTLLAKRARSSAEGKRT